MKALQPIAVPHPGHLANTWVVPLGREGSCALVDAGGPLEETERLLKEHNLSPEWVLISHHHHDHVTHANFFRESYGSTLAMDPWEAKLIDLQPDVEAAEGKKMVLTPGVTAEAWRIPGHTQGQTAWSLTGVGVFTGDTLFKGSVGGCRGPGHGNFQQLASSLSRLAALPPEIDLFPGHGPQTTVARELENNPLLRVILGLDEGTQTPAQVRGKPCTLIIRAKDYDGGSKALVMWPDGAQDVVPGSWVESP